MRVGEDARRATPATSVGVVAEQLFAPVPGGIGRYVEAMVAHLPAACADLAIDVRWIVGNHSAAGVLRAGLDPSNTVRLALPGRVATRSWVQLRQPPLPRRLLRRVELVHATSAAVPPARGRPLVVTVFDLAFLHFPEAFPLAGRRFHERSLRLTAQEASRVLVPSLATARDLEQSYGIDPERIVVTPLGVDVPDADMRGAEALLHRLGVEGPFLLAVGTLEPRKNLPRLLRAFAACTAALPDHHLVVVGPTGWGDQEPLGDAVRGRLGGRIHLAGSVSDPVLHALYERAALLAYVSLHEGFGLPVLEAMAHGLPVVTSDTSSMPEVAGDAAVLVDPHDEPAIAAALLRVVGDERLRTGLRVAGRARAARFTWQETARATSRAYRDVLDAARLSGPRRAPGTPGAPIERRER